MLAVRRAIATFGLTDVSYLYRSLLPGVREHNTALLAGLCHVEHAAWLLLSALSSPSHCNGLSGAWGYDVQARAQYMQELDLLIKQAEQDKAETLVQLRDDFREYRVLKARTRPALLMWGQFIRHAAAGSMRLPALRVMHCIAACCQAVPGTRLCSCRVMTHVTSKLSVCLHAARVWLQHSPDVC
jgi:hypothetical protein